MDKSISARRKAQQLARNGDLAGAVQEIERVVEAGGGEPYDFVFRGDLLVRMRRFDEAVLAYDEAVSAYERVGLFRNAIAVCKKVLRTDPARKRTHGRLGDLYAKEGLASEAISHFLVFLDGAGDDATGDEFLETLERVAEMAGQRPEATLRITDLFVRAGKEERASQILLDIAEQTEASGANEIAQELRARARAILPPPPAPSLPPLTTEAQVEIVAFPQLESPPICTAQMDPAFASDGEPVEEPVEDPLIDGEPSGNGGSKPRGQSATNCREGHVRAAPGADFEAGLPRAASPEDAEAGVLESNPAVASEDLASAPIAASDADPSGLAKEGSERDALYADLWSAIARQDWLLARELAAAIHEADPEDSVALENLVVVTRELGDTLATIQYLILLGDRKINEEELEESLRCFLKVIELDPENVTARRRLARFREMNVPGSERITEECRNSILSILSADGATVSVKHAGGLESEEWIDLTSLLQEFREETASKFDPNDAAGHYDLGLSHREMGLFEEAIEEFGIVLGSKELAPEIESKTREMRAECLERIERDREAIHEYRAALDIEGLPDWQQAPLRYRLACALQKVGESEEAQAILGSLLGAETPYFDTPAPRKGLGS